MNFCFHANVYVFTQVLEAYAESGAFTQRLCSVYAAFMHCLRSVYAGLGRVQFVYAAFTQRLRSVLQCLRKV
jgi:hypothetical protein